MKGRRKSIGFIFNATLLTEIIVTKIGRISHHSDTILGQSTMASSNSSCQDIRNLCRERRHASFRGRIPFVLELSGEKERRGRFSPSSGVRVKGVINRLCWTASTKRTFRLIRFRQKAIKYSYLSGSRGI